MKPLLLLGLLFLSLSSLFSQNLQFPPSIVSAGGTSSNNHSTQISKWRIGQINILQLNAQINKSGNIYLSGRDNEFQIDNWKITAYPNPVKDILFIQFDINQSKAFGVNVTDMTGRKVFERKAHLVLPNEIVQLDLHYLRPAIYIVNIWSDDDSIYEILKVSKQE